MIPDLIWKQSSPFFELWDDVKIEQFIVIVFLFFTRNQQGRRSMFRIGGAKVRKIAIFSARSARNITILDFARVARRKF